MRKNQSKPPATAKEQKLKQSLQEAGPEGLLHVLETDPQARHIVSITVSKQFSGPIPSPEYLEKYQSIDPKLVDRILEHADREQAHRFKYEDQSLKEFSTVNARGQRFSIVIALGGLAAASVIAVLSPFSGSSYAAGAIGVAALGMPIGKSILDAIRSKD